MSSAWLLRLATCLFDLAKTQAYSVDQYIFIGDELSPSLRLMIPIDIHIIALSASLAHGPSAFVCI
jgi:hypothetical protein